MFGDSYDVFIGNLGISTYIQQKRGIMTSKI